MAEPGIELETFMSNGKTLLRGQVATHASYVFLKIQIKTQLITGNRN